MYLVTLNILNVQPLTQHLSHNLHKINELMPHMVEWKHFRITVYLRHSTIIGPPISEEIYVVEFTGLERMMVLNNIVLHRNHQLLFSFFERKNSKKYEIEGAPAAEIAYFYTTFVCAQIF
jgi:hypothetical protein